MTPPKKPKSPMGIPFDGKPVRGAEQSWGSWAKHKVGIRVRCPECGTAKDVPYGDLRDKYAQSQDNLVSRRVFRCTCGFSRHVSIMGWSDGLMKG